MSKTLRPRWCQQPDEDGWWWCNTFPPEIVEVSGEEVWMLGESHPVPVGEMPADWVGPLDPPPEFEEETTWPR